MAKYTQRRKYSRKTNLEIKKASNKELKQNALTKSLSWFKKLVN